jgi:RNA polymerase sigma-70 factor (ECF subfamily)
MDPFLMLTRSTEAEPQVLKTSLEHFFAGIEARAYRMALIATGQKEEALDIVQDAMLKVVQGYADRSPEQWPPIFYRVLQNRITDWHRKSKFRQLFTFWQKDNHEESSESDHPLEQFADDVQQQPNEALHRQNALTAVDHALHRLPPRQQQVFLLRLWEGLSVAETAQAMGCSAGSVKTHLSRALQTLRQELHAFNPSTTAEHEYE